jgi:hypothetical protein
MKYGARSRGASGGAGRAVVALVAVTLALSLSACSPRSSGGSGASTTSTTPLSFVAPGQTTTTLPGQTTSSSTTTTTGLVSAATVATIPGETTTTVPPIAIGDMADDGTIVVDIDEALTEFVARFRSNAGNPYYQIRTTDAVGFLLDIELYTVAGPGWTGQTGSFTTDCELNGICVYFRPPDQGEVELPAMLAGPFGRIDIRSLDASRISVTLTDLRFDRIGRPEVYVFDSVVLDLVPLPPTTTTSSSTTQSSTTQTSPVDGSSTTVP